MIVLRGLAFLFFLLVAIGLVVWQVDHVRGDLAEAWSPGLTWGAMALGAAIVAAQAACSRFLNERNRIPALVIAGLAVLPVTMLVGGVLSLIQARGGQHRQNWEGVLTIGALAGLNVALPLIVGGVVIGGAPGVAAAWTAIKFEFFLVVNYFLARALVHYFNSGASAFVSLRYLRRRVLSLLSVFGIGLGVWALISVNSVMSGFQNDFREQMRGSLSHLLVRFDSAMIQNAVDPAERRVAEWAAYVRRIEANPSAREDWNLALDRAAKHWREVHEPQGDAAALIERLRGGRGLTGADRESLRDDGRIVTPREFYLSRIGDGRSEESRNLRQATEDAVRREWYAPLFREALQREFDKAEAILREHRDPQGRRDVEGVSWRVSTRTLITPRSDTRELHDALLVGVDAERENEISNLGQHIGAAEAHTFREQYVLRPLLNLLGATLGWEHPDSLEDMEARPLFLFTEDGRNIGRVPTDMRGYLGIRRFLTTNNRVRWNEFDRVRFHEFSPGGRVYRRVRDAYRLAERTDDLDRLGTILTTCVRDVRAILRDMALDEPDDERWRQVNRTGARIVLFEFVTGIGATVNAVQHQYEDMILPLRDVLSDADSVSETEREILGALHGEFSRLTEEAQARANNLDATEAEREEALLTMARAYAAALDAPIARARDGGHQDLANFLLELRALSGDAERLLPLRRALAERRALPLGYAGEFYESSAAAVRARQEAYRRVLPLRTIMRDGESIDEYVARATTPGLRPEPDMPGIILGDALAEIALGAGVTVGDSIAITIPRIYFEDNRMVPRTSEVWFRVTGFFRGGLYEENRSRMYCDFEELGALLADTEIRYTLGVRFIDYAPYEGVIRSDRLKHEVRRALDLERVRFMGVSVWEDETRTLLDAVNVERTLIGLIVSFIIALTGGVIFILVYQLVNEKVKDIGILKALGYSPWGIRGVFMFNALFIGLFGAILGVSAGIVTSEYLNEIEDVIERATGIRLFPPEIYFLTYIPSIKGAELFRLALDIAAPVVLFSFLCGIYPAILASRKDPVEALHYE